MSDSLDKYREIIIKAIPSALRTVLNVMNAPGRNAASQLSAAQDILDRAGLGKPPGSTVISNNVSANATVKQNPVAPMDIDLSAYSPEQLKALRATVVEAQRLGVTIYIPDLKPASAGQGLP